MAPLPGTSPVTGPATARQRIRVPSTPDLPPGLGCDVVETSAEHGVRILGFLPDSGCVLARGRRWSWIVPSGSDTDLVWPCIVTYAADAAVLVPFSGVRPWQPGTHSVVHHSGRGVPYTHPILLYFAACCVAGVRPVTAGPEPEHR